MPRLQAVMQPLMGKHWQKSPIPQVEPKVIVLLTHDFQLFSSLSPRTRDARKGRQHIWVCGNCKYVLLLVNKALLFDSFAQGWLQDVFWKQQNYVDYIYMVGTRKFVFCNWYFSLFKSKKQRLKVITNQTISLLGYLYAPLP